MEQALASIITKITELGFRDDEYRNNSKGNEFLGLQYFFKRQENSPWEVYALYNGNSGMLSLHYYNIYGDEDQYPVFFIAIKDDADAKTACKLLEMKTNYFWEVGMKKKRYTSERVSNLLRKAEFSETPTENNITTWTKSIEDNSFTILVETGVSLSIFFYSGDVKGKAKKTLLALRNMQEESSLEEILRYISRSSK